MSQSVETEPGGPPAGEADDLYKLRHSLAHVLAMAVQDLRPGAKLGFGPPIDDGFYYDFVLPEPLSDKDFPDIERRMRQILKRNVKFEEEQLPIPDALERLEEMGEPYKVEYAKELAEKQNLDTLGFYRSGDFVDMCRGPHVAHTGKIPSGSFKLRNVAGAYWRGDSDNVQMTRVYAWAYPTKEELDQHVREYELALERDHKRLGRELDLFEIDTEYVGPGLPLWLPKGTVLRDELEKLAKELEFEAGYERIATPVIAKTDLYYKSGHLPYYQEHMYPFMDLVERDEEGNEEVREQYVLRPMNCPHHHRVFAARPRSYRDLPMRLAEYGTVYRYEDRGALSGLLRVRGMTMNDAHIYCTEDQIKAEFTAVIEMHQRVYEILGLDDFYMRLSTWDPDSEKGKEKYVDDPAAWEKTQNLIREAMDESGVPYVEGKGEAAFYGPKIDVQFRTVTGREETASTNQLDFAQPERMGLVYQGADNQEHRPYVIHRAPLGTHERFVAFLIEHYGGAFPTWLAPVQVRALTVADRFEDYARGVVRELRRDGVRAELDERHDTLGKGIRMAAAEKVPNTLVIGEREVDEQTVTLRRLGSREQETMPVAEFRERLRKAIAERSQTL
ncbi:MAG: threonyl-tRNA synthetase [Solirubrobacteraceae bacterium]|nr:threonyl-tRNA synthetase [Solirubrobacteraceae bacterium]